jgi:hypothetical protein
MQVITRVIIVLLMFQSLAAAQQQFFIHISDYEVRFANWVRTGSQLVGNYYYSYISESDLQSYQQTFKLTGRITGNNISVTYDNSLKNGRFNGKNLELYISDNGRITTRVFKPSSISEHNKQVDRISNISAKLKAQAAELERQAEAKRKALDQAQLLDNQIQELYRTATESLETLKEYKAALEKFVLNPTQFYSDRFRDAYSLHTIIDVVKNAGRSLASVEFNVKRNDCSYLPDVQNSLKDILDAREATKTTPDLTSYYSGIINSEIIRGTERFTLAINQTNRLVNAITRDKVNFKPSYTTTHLSNLKSELETTGNALKTLLLTFDQQVRTTAQTMIDGYHKSALVLADSFKCPKN